MTYSLNILIGLLTVILIVADQKFLYVTGNGLSVPTHSRKRDQTNGPKYNLLPRLRQTSGCR